MARVGTAAEIESFKALVEEYVSSLPFSLDFQDVERELGELSEEYGPPHGAAFLALDAKVPVGCVGLRRFGETGLDAELKRMYVRPHARGRGYGAALCGAAIRAASELGYERIVLDTVAEMTSAAAVYKKAGFSEISPYRENPLASARFYELRLAPGAHDIASNDERAS